MTCDGCTYALWISQKSTQRYAQFYIVVQVFYKEQHTFMFYCITKKTNIYVILQEKKNQT